MIKFPKVLDKEGNLVDISDPRIKSGKNPDFYCPDPCCTVLLTARKGPKNRHHFAHPPEASCYGRETLLHLLAKEVILGMESIILPGISFNFLDLYQILKKDIIGIEEELDFKVPESLYARFSFLDFGLQNREWGFEILGEKTLNTSGFQSSAEVHLHGMTPDLELKHPGKNRSLYLEIYVTHKVDDNKLKKIKEKNLPFLEIDLRKHKNKPEALLDIPALKKIFEERDYIIKWLHFPRQNEFIIKQKEEILREFEKRILKLKVAYHNLVEIFLWNNILSPNSEKYIKKVVQDEAKDIPLLQDPIITEAFINKYLQSSEFHQYKKEAALKAQKSKEEKIRRQEAMDRKYDEIFLQLTKKNGQK